MQFLCRMLDESGLSLTNHELRSQPETTARHWLMVTRYGLRSAKDSTAPLLCFSSWALTRTILWPHPHVTRLLNSRSDVKTWNRVLLPVPHSWPISFTHDFTPLTPNDMILALWSLLSVSRGAGCFAAQAPCSLDWHRSLHSTGKFLYCLHTAFCLCVPSDKLWFSSVT